MYLRVDGFGEPVLFFLHGLGGNWESFRPQVEYLSATHKCLSWTMPSSAAFASTESITWQGFAEHAVGLLEVSDTDRVVAVGQSLGGMIAQQLAFSFPDRVEGLVLVATTAAFGKPGSAFNDEFLAARLAPLDEGLTPSDFAADVVASIVGPNAPPEAIEAAVTSMSAIDADAYRASIECLITWDARSWLPDLEVPTLCIAGADDTNAPPRAVERLAELIPGAQFAVIEEAGHLVNLEQPIAFNELLEGFLASLPGEPR